MYKRCKYGEWCSYDHIESVDTVLEELKLVKEKLEIVQKEIFEKNREAKLILEKLEKYLVLLNNPSTQPAPAKISIPGSSTSRVSTFTIPTVNYNPASSLSSSSDIPQLDGGNGTQKSATIQSHHHELSQVNNEAVETSMWLCQCCHFAHSFETEAELEVHHNTLSIEYEECNICYPWHEWIPQ